MCGICGFYGFQDKKLLKRMTDVIKHRGPDGYGYYSDKHASLGHRRLSIIDLSIRGKQPMCNEDKTIWITFNGEIYNFKEIKKKLMTAGHKFRSNTDTEMIIHAYEEYGDDCIKQFNGMFAFALWDSNKKRMLLARDRFGIKPLYYYWDGKRLMFSSEIKSIIESGMKREPNYYAVIDYLTFQHSLDDKTFFEGIKVLLPSHKLVVTGDSVVLQRYWDLEFRDAKIDTKQNVNEFRRIFSDSVKRHMMSDVDVGSYLSSGFDSSSVATLASEISSKRISTFTGTFKESSSYDYFNEIDVAREVAKNINSKSYEKVITAGEFASNFYKFIYHMDEPKDGSPGVSQMLVSKMISEHVKVVLTGHGGDEVFAGYHHYKSYMFKSMVEKNPLNFLKLFTYFKPNEMPRAFYFLFLAPFVEDAASTGLFVHFSKPERKKLFTKKFYEMYGSYSPSAYVNNYFYGNNISNVDKLQYIYLRTYLPSILIMQDKVDMSNSVEARVPFLDNELVDFAMKIPVKKKLHNNELKYLIKAGMKNKLPTSVYKCPKRGFPTPYALWFRKELKPFLYDTLLSSKAVQRGIFNPRYVKNLLDKFCNSKYHGKLDMVYVNRIWCLICIEAWFRTFIDKQA
ncbi:MAG: asparagine synthase (glutamine-hydrolyzing) [Candidatus Aenigmatarchaeota archaeon]